MDAAKSELLFEVLPSWANADDPHDREALIAEELGEGGDEDEDGTEYDRARLRLALRQVVAHQVADEDPPEVWATAQRLIADG